MGPVTAGVPERFDASRDGEPQGEDLVTVRARGYESLGPITRSVAARWLASNDREKMVRALLRLSLHGPDFAFAERTALEHANHPDVWVRRNVATALSHVSRVHGSIELEAVMETLVSLLDD